MCKILGMFCLGQPKYGSHITGIYVIAHVIPVYIILWLDDNRTVSDLHSYIHVVAVGERVSVKLHFMDL